MIVEHWLPEGKVTHLRNSSKLMNFQYIYKQMHLKSTVHTRYWTPTCFGTGVPSSGSHRTN